MLYIICLYQHIAISLLQSFESEYIYVITRFIGQYGELLHECVRYCLSQWAIPHIVDMLIQTDLMLLVCWYRQITLWWLHFIAFINVKYTSIYITCTQQTYSPLSYWSNKNLYKEEKKKNKKTNNKQKLDWIGRRVFSGISLVPRLSFPFRVGGGKKRARYPLSAHARKSGNRIPL